MNPVVATAAKDRLRKPILRAAGRFVNRLSPPLLVILVGFAIWTVVAALVISALR